MAKISKNYIVCDKMISQDLKESCYTDVAILLDDFSVCDGMQVQDRKDNCYLISVMRSKNFSLCDNIAESNKSLTCFAVAAKDASYCEREQSSWKSSCYLVLAKAWNDVSFCGMMPDKDGIEKYETESALTKCYIEVARYNKNERICDGMDATADKIRFSCYVAVAQENGDARLCEKISNESKSCYPTGCFYYRDSCISGVALYQNDESICGLIKDENAKTSCLENLNLYK